MNAISSSIESLVVQSKKPVVFDFLDYRNFLNEAIQFKRKKNPQLSLTVIAKKTKMSRSLFVMILNGTRNLSEDHLSGVIEAFDLNPMEAEFFKTLVQHNQSHDPITQKSYLERIHQLIPESKFHHIRDRETFVVQHWFILPLLEMLSLDDFKFDVDYILKRFNHRVKKTDLIRTIKELLHIGLIQWTDEKLTASNRTIVFGSGDVPMTAIQNYHALMHSLGLEILPQIATPLRDFSSTSIAIHRDDIKKLKEKIAEFRKSILVYQSQIKNPQEVYQLNIQFFPVTIEKEHS